MIVIGISMFGFMSGLVFSDDIDMSCVTMINDLKINQNSTNIRNLTQNFCSLIDESKCTHDGDVFDANQSVFITLLCDNVGKDELFTSIVREGDNSILMKTGFNQFGIYDYGFGEDTEGTDINFCDYKINEMNGCDYANHLPKMFDEIMNDIFNIKQADLYGVDILDENVTPDTLANEFSKANFQGLTTQRGLEQGLCDPNSEYYDDTCNYLKNYMKNVKNLLNKTKVINVLNLSKGKTKTLCQSDFQNNILYCGLLGDDISPEYSFINAVYNEYMWYRLFVSYYSYELSVDSKFSELINGNRIEKLNLNRDKIYSFQEQIARSRQSVSVALRSLSEISSSFALHVGFLMYQEDSKIFMKTLSKLYPPIITLFDKLRNVQKAE